MLRAAERIEANDPNISRDPGYWVAMAARREIMSGQGAIISLNDMPYDFNYRDFFSRFILEMKGYLPGNYNGPTFEFEFANQDQKELYEECLTDFINERTKEINECKLEISPYSNSYQIESKKSKRIPSTNKFFCNVFIQESFTNVRQIKDLIEACRNAMDELSRRHKHGCNPQECSIMFSEE